MNIPEMTDDISERVRLRRGFTLAEFAAYVEKEIKLDPTGGEDGRTAKWLLERFADALKHERKLSKPRKAKKKKLSRVDRWMSAATNARSALEDAREYLEALKEVHEEYVEWRDNLPDNLQYSALGEKLDAVADGIDVEGAFEGVEEAIGVCEEAESTDMPMGFGRD